MKAQLTFLLLACGLTSCNLVKGAPSVDVKMDVVSQYNFRGVVQNEEIVVQPAASIQVPLGASSGVGAGFWANANIYDDTGDSTQPDGNGQSFSEIDTNATFYQRAGGVEYALGAINYSYPTNTTATPSQVDAFASAEWEANGWGNAFSAYYSLNDFGGLYVRADFSRAWTVNQRTSLDLSLGIAYSDEENALLYYGISESGLADVSLTGALSYVFDKRTTGSIFVTTVTLVESDYETALEAQGIDPSNTIFGVSLGWSY